MAIDLIDFLPRREWKYQTDAEAVEAAFNAAGEVLACAGGGTLHVAPGEWAIKCTDRLFRFGVWLKTPNIRLRGAGMRATVLRLRDGEDCDVVGVSAPGISIERLTVRGNLERPPAKNRPHGIAIRADPTFVSICDVVVESVPGYAIFVIGRRDTEGVYTNVSLHNVIIDTCGNDGIDFKQRHETEKADYQPALYKASGPRAFLKNIAIQGHSALYPDRDLLSRGENGLDIRGQAHMRNVEVLGVKPGRFGVGGSSGICFRETTPPERLEPQHDHGKGAQWSTLTNYFISRLPPVPGERHGRGGGVFIAPSIKDFVSFANGNALDLKQDRLSPENP